MNYEVKPEMIERINNEGTYHAPQGDQATRYLAMRDFATEFKFFVLQNTPASREQSSALTSIDEATFWGNAAIARHETESDR